MTRPAVRPRRRRLDAATQCQRLGQTVVAAWRARAYDERALPSIAAAALAEADLAARITPDDLIDWVEKTPELPTQVDLEGTFGQPPLTLFCHPRLRLEALFWVDSTTAIHHHGFRGAFQVLAGASLHTEYEFTVDDVVSSRFQLGRLRQAGVEYLRRGDIRPIDAGPKFIHSLFHLDRPSVTVVVRSHDDASAGPPLEYHRPSVAIDTRLADATLRRKLQLVSYLATIQSPRRRRFLERTLAGSDLAGALLALEHVAIRETGLDLAPFIAQIRRRHGARAAGFDAVIAEWRRADYLTRRRRELVGRDHRFLLGLLGVTGREPVLDLVAAAYGGDPAERIAGWLDELAVLLPAGDPLALRLGPVERRVLVELLRGTRLDALERVVPLGRADLRTLCTAFQRSALLSGWFAAT